MGLFDAFKKKDCEICGKEVGMFGYKKLEDGEICKDCVKLLSPWFDDRRHSTVDQIKAQLAYRAQNQQDLASFRVSQVIGEEYKMYIEEVNGVPTRFLISDAQSYMDENPDIIRFADLLSCTIDVDADETELKKEDANGNEISYSPPRYETEYDFYVDMQIGNNPYFDDIRFKLNSSSVTLETRGATTGSFLGMSFGSGPVDMSRPREQERYEAYNTMCQQIEEIVRRSRMEPQVEAQPAPQEPAGPKFCQNCGAPAEGGKFCQYCGAKF